MQQGLQPLLLQVEPWGQPLGQEVRAETEQPARGRAQAPRSLAPRLPVVRVRLEPMRPSLVGPPWTLRYALVQPHVAPQRVLAQLPSALRQVQVRRESMLRPSALLRSQVGWHATLRQVLE